MFCTSQDYCEVYFCSAFQSWVLHTYSIKDCTYNYGKSEIKVSLYFANESLLFFTLSCLHLGSAIMWTSIGSFYLLMKVTIMPTIRFNRAQTLYFLSSFSHIPSLILNGYAIFPWQINHSILNFPLSPIEPKDNIYLAAILVFNMNSGVPLSTLSWKVHFTRLIQMATCKTGKSSLKIMIFKQNLSLWNWFRPNSDHYDPRNEYCHFSILDNYLALKIFNLWLVLH